jgi:hypothetical protein
MVNVVVNSGHDDGMEAHYLRKGGLVSSDKRSTPHAHEAPVTGERIDDHGHAGVDVHADDSEGYARNRRHTTSNYS